MTVAQPGLPATLGYRVWPPARLRERWRFAVVLAFLMVLIGAEIAFAYTTTISNKATDDAVERTQAVIKQTNLAMAAFSDMELGYHGYLLTGDETFLGAYSAGRSAYREALQRLEQQTSRNGSQLSRWQTIRQLAGTWETDITEPAIAQRPAISDVLVSQVLSSQALAADRSQIEQIRAVFADAITAEEAILAQRRAAQADADERLLVVLVWGTSAAVLLSLALGGWILLHLERERLRGVWLTIQTSEHELYNRLTTARGNLELVLREPGLSERQQRWIRRAHLSVLSSAEAVARMRELPHLRETHWSPESRVTTFDLED